MIKRFCDKCGKEIKENETWEGNIARRYPSSVGHEFHEFHLCNECAHELLDYLFGGK